MCTHACLYLYCTVFINRLIEACMSMSKINRYFKTKCESYPFQVYRISHSGQGTYFMARKPQKGHKHEALPSHRAQTWKGESVSSGFSTDGSLISASAVLHWTAKCTAPLTHYIISEHPFHNVRQLQFTEAPNIAATARSTGGAGLGESWMATCLASLKYIIVSKHPFHKDAELGPWQSSESRVNSRDRTGHNRLSPLHALLIYPDKVCWFVPLMLCLFFVEISEVTQVSQHKESLRFQGRVKIQVKVLKTFYHHFPYE